jgi:hypothetical protein
MRDLAQICYWIDDYHLRPPVGPDYERLCQKAISSRQKARAASMIASANALRISVGQDHGVSGDA